MSDDRENISVHESHEQGSSKMTSNDLKEILKVHAAIYAAQKKKNDSKRTISEDTELDDTILISTPRSSNGTAIIGPREPKLRKTMQDVQNALNNSLTAENVKVLYEKTLNGIKDTLSRDADSICITFDYPKIDMDHRFIAVTAHYIDKDFELKHILLECKFVSNINNIVILVEELERVASEFDINRKIIHTIVGWNSPNTDEAIKRVAFCNDNNFTWCFLELLKKIAIHAIKQMDFLFKKIMTIANHINRNKDVLKCFTDNQIKMSKTKEPKLLAPPERWNWVTKIIALQRFTSLKHAVKACIKEAVDESILVSEEEWEIADQLYEVLKPLNEISWIHNQTILTIPISTVIVFTNCLRSIFLDTDYSNFKESVKNTVESIKADLKDLFIEETDTFKKTLGVCTFLDPRFKNYEFQSENIATAVKNYVCDLIIEMIDNNSDDQLDTDDITVWKSFDKLVVKSSANRELQMYIDAESLPRKTPDGLWSDPAQWWREHKAIYPHLSEIYRTKCNIVGTAVHGDRLRLNAETLSKQWNLEDSLEQLAFLNENQVLGLL